MGILGCTVLAYLEEGNFQAPPGASSIPSFARLQSSVRTVRAILRGEFSPGTPVAPAAAVIPSAQFTQSRPVKHIRDDEVQIVDHRTKQNQFPIALRPLRFGIAPTPRP